MKYHEQPLQAATAPCKTWYHITETRQESLHRNVQVVSMARPTRGLGTRTKVILKSSNLQFLELW